jgi:hypothetical protein
MPIKMVPTAECEIANRVAASVRLAANASDQDGPHRGMRDRKPRGGFSQACGKPFFTSGNRRRARALVYSAVCPEGRGMPKPNTSTIRGIGTSARPRCGALAETMAEVETEVGSH